MKTRMRVAMAVVGLVGVWSAASRGQGPEQGGRATAPAVPTLATDRAMFWTAAEIEARWKENEALRRNNSRLFNGPTNISANVRIVAGEDPPLVHPTTADLWIVTAGTATALTDGKLAEGGTSIVGATSRPVRVGDVLFVPPGVPHHFTGMKGFRAWLMRFDTVGLERTGPVPAGATAPTSASAAAPSLATDRTMFWTAAEIEGRWKENESLKRANSRIFNGPANISANVRIVLDGDPPLTHVGTADLWLVTAGTAVARTDGEIVETGGMNTIRNGTARKVGPGDLLYVPPGVPHHFTDMKEFRAWLIRYDVEGWRQAVPPAGSGAAP
jgi:mannose-6-phosphate isomerase-like protein (cupin superfamily)